MPPGDPNGTSGDMTYTIPTIEPWDLPAGDTRRHARQGVTLSWYKTLSNFLPADGWILTYLFTKSDERHSVVASDNGDGRFLCSAAATDTDDWAIGVYSVFGYVSLGADVHEVYRGTCEVLVGYQLAGNASGVDDRTHARKVRDALRALLENRATDDQTAFSVSMPDGSSRSISRMDREQLITALNRYEFLVKLEEDAERLDRGLGVRNKIRVRLQ